MILDPYSIGIGAGIIGACWFITILIKRKPESRISDADWDMIKAVSKPAESATPIVPLVSADKKPVDAPVEASIEFTDDLGEDPWSKKDMKDQDTT